MKYMLLLYADEQVWSESEREKCYGESSQLAHQLKSKGQYLAASPLQPVATATSVRVRDSKRLVTDGPFAETREQLGGYFLVNAKDLDEAIHIAGRLPGARKGTVKFALWLRSPACRPSSSGRSSLGNVKKSAHCLRIGAHCQPSASTWRPSV